MADPFQLDLKDAAAVCDVLTAGARANRDAVCRRGSIDLIQAPGTLIATGDLHDHPLHLARLMQAAGMPGGADGSAHLVLHEIIHSDRLLNGMDFSYRMLVRVAALKAEFPERVHTVLANHELAQMVGAGIVKEGVKVVEAFNEGIHFTFADAAPAVDEAVRDFVRSMPLALRCKTPRGDVLCAHSLPAPYSMQRFDPSVLTRDLTEGDYEPRQGAAHLMVWGRGYDAELIEDLVERWGINLFLLGHEHVPEGVRFVPPCVVVLNSDHNRGVYLPVDLSDPPKPENAAFLVRPLNTPG